MDYSGVRILFVNKHRIFFCLEYGLHNVSERLPSMWQCLTCFPCQICNCSSATKHKEYTAHSANFLGRKHYLCSIEPGPNIILVSFFKCLDNSMLLHKDWKLNSTCPLINPFRCVCRNNWLTKFMTPNMLKEFPFLNEQYITAIIANKFD